jgi:uncharacterized protein YndB with AHSA1/START domain
MHATYEMIDSRPALRFERTLGHPIDAVWRAITEPEELAQWFPSEVEVELVEGGRMTFTFPEQPLPDGPTTMAGEVTELDPPRVFAFTWGGDHLRFELERGASGDATELRFTVLLDATDKAARDAAGWHQCLDGLDQLLAGDGEVRYVPDEWRGYYAEYERRGVPTGAFVPDTHG